MTRAIGFRKSEIQQLAEIARREGVRMEMERNGCFIRADPEPPAALKPADEAREPLKLLK